MASACRRGFTLIELSIVLVIIGLIVGGILTGQSLIAAADAANSLVATSGTGKTAMFWDDLSTARLIDGGYSTASSTQAPPNGTVFATTMSTFLPPGKIGNGNFLYVWCAATGTIVLGRSFLLRLQVLHSACRHLQTRLTMYTAGFAWEAGPFLRYWNVPGSDIVGVAQPMTPPNERVQTGLALRITW